MSHQANALQIEQAAALVQQVLASLDRTAETCPACTVRHWMNRDEYQLGIELEAIINKLGRAAHRLRRLAPGTVERPRDNLERNPTIPTREVV